jgi:hypothetical protein
MGTCVQNVFSFGMGGISAAPATQETADNIPIETDKAASITLMIGPPVCRLVLDTPLIAKGGLLKRRPSRRRDLAPLLAVFPHHVLQPLEIPPGPAVVQRVLAALVLAQTYEPVAVYGTLQEATCEELPGASPCPANRQLSKFRSPVVESRTASRQMRFGPI